MQLNGRGFAFALIGMLGAAGPALTQQVSRPLQPAQQPGLPPTLLPLLTTPEHRTALLQAARAVDPPGTAPCPDENYVTTGEVGILVPPKLDASGKIIEGVWKETISATGCGAPRLLNAMTLVKPDGTLQTVPLLPGTTIADPQLQRDSVQYAAAGMGAMPPGCDRGGVADTKFLGVDGQPAGTRPTPGAPPQPWSELWTLDACGTRANVIMHFTPDANGTAISATRAAS